MSRHRSGVYVAILGLWDERDTWLTHRQIAARVGQPGSNTVYAAVTRLVADSHLERRLIPGTCLAEFRPRRQAQLKPLNFHKILTAGDSDNPMRALNTHGQTGTCGGTAQLAHHGKGQAERKSVGRKVKGAGSGTAGSQMYSRRQAQRAGAQG